MDLIVNGESRAFEDVATIAELLSKIGVSPQGTGIAVAVNETVVPRTDWPQRVLSAGDRIEIINAVQGG